MTFGIIISTINADEQRTLFYLRLPSFDAITETEMFHFL